AVRAKLLGVGPFVAFDHPAKGASGSLRSCFAFLSSTHSDSAAKNTTPPRASAAPGVIARSNVRLIGSRRRSCGPMDAIHGRSPTIAIVASQSKSIWPTCAFVAGSIWAAQLSSQVVTQTAADPTARPPHGLF